MCTSTASPPTNLTTDNLAHMRSVEVTLGTDCTETTTLGGRGRDPGRFQPNMWYCFLLSHLQEAALATNPFFAGTAEMAARQEAFNKKLPNLSDDELFEEFHSIKALEASAAVGNGEDQSEDLLHRSLATEAEISHRNGGQGLLQYNKWVAARKK